MAESAATNPGTKQKKGNKKWRVHLKGYEAVILYPALVTPCLVERKTGCLTVILAVKDDFKKIYDLSLVNHPISWLAAQALHSQLCLARWGDGAVPGPDDFQYIGHKRQVTSQKHMIYLDHVDAVNKYGDKPENDYRGWYLGELPSDKDFLVKGFNESGQEVRKFGVIHRGAAKMYVDDGYNHLIQLNFRNFVNLVSAGMYELCYVYFKLYNDEDDLKANEKEAKAEGKEVTKDPTPADPPKPPMRCDYTDPDDDVLNRYFAKEKRLKQKPKLLRTATQIKALKPVGYDKLFQLYGEVTEKEKAEIEVKRPNQKKPDTYRREYAAVGPHYLQSRHPVYIYTLEKWGDKEPWQGRIGVMGDLHVSSRQSLFRWRTRR